MGIKTYGTPPASTYSVSISNKLLERLNPLFWLKIKKKICRFIICKNKKKCKYIFSIFQKKGGKVGNSREEGNMGKIKKMA